MSEITDLEKRVIRFTQNREMGMPHLSPEVQERVKALKAEMLAGGTTVGKVQPEDTGSGSMYMEQEGKIVRMTAFEVGFMS